MLELVSRTFFTAELVKLSLYEAFVLCRQLPSLSQEQRTPLKREFCAAVFTQLGALAVWPDEALWLGFGLLLFCDFAVVPGNPELGSETCAGGQGHFRGHSCAWVGR